MPTAVTVGEMCELHVYQLSGNKYAITPFMVTSVTEAQTANATTKALTYATPFQLASFLNLKNSFYLSSNPNLAKISDLLFRIEDMIDNRTGHAWRLRYSGTVTGADTAAVYEQIDLSFNPERYAGVPFYLGHRAIRTISDLSVYDGSSGAGYTDWKATKTEGRNSDWWGDYTQGVIYLRTWYYQEKNRGIKAKYSYGETSVDRRVEHLAIIMAAKEFLMNEDRSVLMVEGSSNVAYDKRIDKWDDEIDGLFRELSEFKIPRVTW